MNSRFRRLAMGIFYMGRMWCANMYCDGDQVCIDGGDHATDKDHMSRLDWKYDTERLAWVFVLDGKT